jgi:queuosine precursor transporter
VTTRLAILTGFYVAVVCAAQIGAQKIIVLPGTSLEAPGGVYAIGLALALIELAHHTAPSRQEGWRNAQLMVVAGFGASALLAGYIAIVAESKPAFPGQTFDDLADTWRIVTASLLAFIVSESIDNSVGIALRDRAPDAVRVLVTNGISVPIDSAIFLIGAFGVDGLDFFEGQVVGKLAATVLIGLPAVLIARRSLMRERPLPAAASS